MKRSLFSALFIALATSMAFGQTIVNTDPENKKVILEEFTGIKCVFCPEGHAIAQAIQDNNPGEVFLINIHTGSFAVPGAGEPDFRTPFGTAIANQSQLVGYPAGTVNRHYFPGRAQNGGTGTAMSRNFWTISASETMDEPSYMNMAVESVIDVQTREMEVHVEAFYTGDSPEPVNKLNVALLQNNTLGPQTGGNMGDEYVHMHRLVYLLTDQWGEDVSPTTTGTFIDRTYTYSIPEDYNDVPVELADLEVVVFMTETTQEIISGNGAYPDFTNLEFQNDIFVKEIKEIPDLCVNVVAPVVVIQNMGEEDVTSLDIEYNVNGTSHTYTWTGNLTSLANVTVELPEVGFEFQGTNNVSVSVPDDENNSNNEQVTTFNDAQEFVGELTLTIQTDNWGEEVTWYVKDYEGTVITGGGNYPDNSTIVETIELPEDSCYTFELLDSYGDGGGPVTLEDSEGTVIYSTPGDYGSGETKNFGYAVVILGVTQSELTNVVLFPNPTNTAVTIANAENAQVAIFNILGQKIMEVSNISNSETIDVSRLQAGTYFVQIAKEGQSTTEKLIVSQ